MPALDHAAQALDHHQAFRFHEAARCVRSAFDSASPASALEAARILIKARPIFPDTSTAIPAEVYYRELHEQCVEHLGAESRAALVTGDILAGLLQSNRKLDEACELREAIFAAQPASLAYDDPTFLIARDNLALLYRQRNQSERAATLYANTGICEHLASVQAALVAGGNRIYSCCQPWSQNCHIWVYFERPLDCASLIRGLDSCVQLNEHGGTHDGSERGLVCNTHNDGLMGPLI